MNIPRAFLLILFAVTGMPVARAETLRIGTVRLLVDDPSNGRVNLVADPVASGDRDLHLPGYAAGSPRMAALEVMFVGQPKNYASKVRIREQVIEVVCHVPGGVAGTVDFFIESVSTLRGVATNVGLEGIGEELADYFFLDPRTLLTTSRRLGVAINTAKHEARVDLGCRDFGGRCRVSAVVRPAGGGLLVIGAITIPRDDDGDGLADLWEREAHSDPGAISPNDDNDRFDPPVLGEKPGDGLSAIEEYRGFLIRGRHYRLNEKATDGPGVRYGGPLSKDLFLFEQPRGKNGFVYVGPTAKLKLKNNRFLEPYGVALHLIDPWEAASRHGPGSGPVDFNGDANQAALVLINQHSLRVLGAPTRAFGLSELGLNQRRGQSGSIYSLPILIDTESIKKFFEPLEKTDAVKAEDQMHWTFAHELGHKLGLKHPTVTFARSISPLADPAGGPRRPSYWVQVETPSIRSIRWWGPVTVVTRGETTKDFDLEDILFVSKLRRLFLSKEDREALRKTLNVLTGSVSALGDATTRTSVVVHGETHPAQQYGFIVRGQAGPPGRPLIVEVHGGTLLDRHSDIKSLQDHLSIEQKVTIEIHNKP